MADVMALCPRVILIHHGQLLYDGELGGLAQRLAPFKLLRVTLKEGNGKVEDWQAGKVERSFLDPWVLPEGVEVLERQAGRMTLRAARTETPAITAHLLQSLPVMDLVVEDPPIEAVIDQIYQEGEV
jgi:ABC-2 type transport system ATP-binding protein